MADFEFHYTLNEQDFDAFKEEGVRRMADLCAKGFHSKLSPERMYAQLYGSWPVILCIITHDTVPVGFMMLHEAKDIFAGKNLLVIDAAHFDNVPGLFEAAEAEVERLVEIEQYDAVRFFFNRKGWLRKMKMRPDAGYKVLAQVAEKDYVWRKHT